MNIYIHTNMVQYIYYDTWYVSIVRNVYDIIYPLVATLKAHTLVLRTYQYDLILLTTRYQVHRQVRGEMDEENDDVYLAYHTSIGHPY